MVSSAISHLVFCPADGVTDADEWFGRLDAAVGLRGDARWHGESEGLAADLPHDEADRVLDCARNALGDSLEWERAERDDEAVLITDAAGGRPVDE